MFNLQRSRFVVLSLLMTLGAAQFPRLARADDGAMTVTLKSGAIYRGELIEKVPGDHVTIKLATGDVKTFSWAEIAPEKAADTQPPSPVWHPPVSRQESTPQADGPSAPTVRVRAPAGTHLERFAGSSTLGAYSVKHWEVVCSVPCDQPIPAGEYRFDGGSFTPTDQFTFDGSGTEIEAKLGTKAQKYGGYVLLNVGWAAAFGGFIVPVIASDSVSSSTNTGLIVLGIAGTALALVGIGLIAGNTSEVKVDGRTVASLSVPLTGGIALTPSGFTF